MTVFDSKLFQVSVKALIFKEGKVLLLHERQGFWDLPGGRMEHGQSFRETLERECLEEMGVGCTVLDKHPFLAWTGKDDHEHWRVFLCFRVELDSFEFKESDECIEHGFFSKEELDRVDMFFPIRELKEFL